MKRLIGLGLAVVCAALLAACSNAGNSASDNSSADQSAAASPAAVAAASSAPAQNGAMASDGAGVYAMNCSSCHQSNGKGVSGAFPPLAANDAVTGDPAKLIHIVKYGLSGKISAAGTTYNGTMPNWTGNLTDAQIASVVTYVRSSWGNHASAVSAADVTAVKK